MTTSRDRMLLDGRALCLVDTDTTKQVVTCANKDGVIPLAIIDDNLAYAFSGRRNALVKIDLNKDTTVTQHKFPVNMNVSAGTLFPNGRFLAIGNQSGKIYLWNIASQKMSQPLETGQADPVRHIAASADGKLLLVSTSLRGGDWIRQKTLTVWNLVSNAIVRQVSIDGPYAMLPDRSKAIVAQGTVISVLDYRTGQMTRFATQGSPVSAMAISGDGNTLVSGDGDVVELWEFPQGRRLARFHDKTNRGSIVLSHDGRIVYTQNGSIRLRP